MEKAKFFSPLRAGLPKARPNRQGNPSQMIKNGKESVNSLVRLPGRWVFETHPAALSGTLIYDDPVD
jgi:hypothetical protein